MMHYDRRPAESALRKQAAIRHDAFTLWIWLLILVAILLSVLR